MALPLIRTRFGTLLQILLFLPLTLATLSTAAFLSLSLLLTIHSVIHSTMNLFIPSLQNYLPFLQVCHFWRSMMREICQTYHFSGSLTPSFPSPCFQFVSPASYSLGNCIIDMGRFPTLHRTCVWVSRRTC